MAQDEQMAKMYYSLIKEGAKYIKEDKSVKSPETALLQVKKGLAEFAKQNNLASVDNILLPCNEMDFDFSSLEFIQNGNEFSVYLAAKRNPFYAPIFTFKNIHYSKHRAILFIARWAAKKWTKENLKSLKETVKKMKFV